VGKEISSLHNLSTKLKNEEKYKMGTRRFTASAYKVEEKKVFDADGDTSHAGRQRQQQGLGLDPLVDPAANGLIRRSLPRYVEQTDGTLLLPNGIPILIENRFDSTGSMGENVKKAFNSLPLLYEMLSSGQRAVLSKYDVQIINGIFGDRGDKTHILWRSQAEMDIEIARQLTFMVPEMDGGDYTEDPDYGLFAGAYLTDAFINRYDLKYYDFLITDAPCRERIDLKSLQRVFGSTVFEKTKENGFSINEGQLPTTQEIIHELKKRAHAFVLCVGGDCVDHWRRLYGKENVVVIPDTSGMHVYQATIIGLTEGFLCLDSITEYLEGVGVQVRYLRG
jgi:hypothetical protein